MKIRSTYRAAASLFALFSTSAAMAQASPTVLGGGSSLVAPAISTEVANFGTDPLSLSYINTSSGTGQAAS